MRPLLIILSCAKYEFLAQLQYDLFLKRSAIEYRFFVGRGCEERGDTIVLDVDDDFASLPFKSQAAFRWALERGYDQIFKMDTDTYVVTERLLKAKPKDDYVGYFFYEPGPGAYASGGSGYWLSERAAAMIVSTQLMSDPLNAEPCIEVSTRGEDLQVCWALREKGIHCVKDDRYRLRAPGPMIANNYITSHDVVVHDKRERLLIADKVWKKSCGR